MKLSARNVLKGKVIAVTKGVTTSNIKLDLGNGIVITSSITVEATKDSNSRKAMTLTPSSRLRKSLSARNERRHSYDD